MQLNLEVMLRLQLELMNPDILICKTTILSHGLTALTSPYLIVLPYTVVAVVVAPSWLTSAVT